MDILENECETGTYECGSHAYCSDTDEGYECLCEEGYEGDGSICTGTISFI